MKDAAGLAARLTELITRPTERDRQRRIGPSSLGDPCDRCLGLELAQIHRDGPHMPPERFNLSAWVGTSVHAHLERLIRAEQWIGARQEYKVTVGRIKKYGTITGKTDLYDELSQTICDFKTTSKANAQKFRKDGTPPVTHDRQVDCYGLGLVNEGHQVSEKMIFYIPRDSYDPADMWAYIAPVNLDNAYQALARAERIWLDYVRPGKTDLLRSLSGCFNCNPWRRTNITFTREDR